MQSLSKDNPVYMNFESDSDVMLVAFGGLKGGVGRILPFEFFNITKEIGTKKLYVRDPRQMWYHLGLPGVANSIDGIKDHLKPIIKGQNPRRVVVVGNSAGGYAALLFGCLLDVDTVIAFSPQTFLNKDLMGTHQDNRWTARLMALYRVGEEKYYNLKRVLFRHRHRKTRYKIHFPEQNRLDYIHAWRMRDVPTVSLRPYESDTHHLVTDLRDSGKLKEILLKDLK